MNDRSKPWEIYTSSSSSSNPSPAQSDSSEAAWKSFGTSMNAISFGFVATAILVSMFLIMAIFEHLFKPSPSEEDDDDNNLNGSSLESGTAFRKLGNPQAVSTRYSSDLSVVMPGNKYPTYIAQPAPFPCQREGVHWPSH